MTSPENVAASGAFIVVGWLRRSVLFGAYDKSYFARRHRRVPPGAHGLDRRAAGLVGIGCYLTRFPLSRGFYVLLFVLGVPLLMLSRYAGRRVIQRLRTRGALSRRILIAGAPAHVEARRRRAPARVLAGLLHHRLPDRRRAGRAHRDPHRHPGAGPHPRRRPASWPVAEVDTLLIAEGAFEEGTTLRQMAWELEKHADLEIAVAPSLTDVAAARVEVRPVAGPAAGLHRPHPRAGLRALGQARLRHRRLTRSAPALLAPVWLWAVLRIKLHDGGPVLFRQTRVGRDGAPSSA